MKERYFQVTFIPFDEGYLKALRLMSTQAD